MLIKEHRKAIKATQQPPVKADLNSLFSAPKGYTTGSVKKLRDHHSGDWWLNVDYVEAETALA